MLKNNCKNFNPSTVIVEYSYPLYKCRSPDDVSGAVHVGYKRIRGVLRRIDVRWAVLYSTYLLLNYGCHCNVEYCNSIKTIKYLFKYPI